MANVKDGASKTLNRVTKWDNVGTPSISDSIIHDDGANVGIGVTGPGAKLEVEGDAASAGSESIALKVTDGSVAMFEVVDASDDSMGSPDNRVTLFRSRDGQMCVVPKDSTSTAIQEAINYLVGQSTDAEDVGGIVYLPAGTYQITSDITIGEGQVASPTGLRRGSGIQIVGAGPYATILEIDSGASATKALHIRGGQWADGTPYPATNVVIKDLAITIQSGGTDGIHTGIQNDYAFNMTVDNVRIEGNDASERFEYGIVCGCWTNLFKGCRIYYTREAGIRFTFGTLSDASSTVHSANLNTVLNCDVEYFRAAATGNGYGIWIGNGTGSAKNRGNVIIGSQAQNNDASSGVGIYLDENSEGTTVTGCYFEATAKAVYVDSENNAIMSNYYLGCPTMIDVEASKKAGNVILRNSPSSETGEEYPVWSGDLDIADTTDLASEDSLNENSFATHDKWETGGDGDFDDTGGNATYSHTSGPASPARTSWLVQSAANLKVAGVGNRWYKLTYTVSSVTGSDNISSFVLTSAFAETTQSLYAEEGTHEHYFRSAAAPTNFVIAATSIDDCSFVLDDLYLKEVQGGDAIVSGLITGGGTSGIKVLSNGYTGIGTTSPSALLTLKDASAALLVLNASDTPIARLGVNASGNAQLDARDTNGNVRAQLVTATSAAYLDLKDSSSTTVRVYSNGASYFNGGNVGVGVTDPDEKLEVNGVIKVDAGNYSLKLEENDIRFNRNGISYIRNDTGSSSTILFSVNSHATMELVDQKVSIASDSLPAEALDVNGNIQVSGSGNGLILKSPNGHRWKLTIDNNGSTTWTDLDA
jgi:hypothetical protein